MRLLITLYNTRRVVRYIISGTIAAAVNIGTLFVLVHFAGVHYLISSTIAFLSSLIVSFTLQKFLTFRDTEVEHAPLQFFIYITIAGINLCLNAALMYTLVTLLNIWYLLAQVIAGVLIAIVSYLSYRTFVFKADSGPAT